ncbi:MAG: hypothetical protein V9E90_08810 [Saprospiraceae bacterium]
MNLIEGMVEADHVLLGQAVDEVHRNALETELACRIDYQLGFVQALHPVHGHLYFRREILHTDAHAIEAQFAEHLDSFAVDLARIHFDRIFAAGQQTEMLADDVHQASHFVVRKESRCAAAEVQLNHVATAVQRRFLHRDFLAQVLDVLGGTAMVLGDDLVAGAVVANRIAEGDVDV